MIVVKQYGERRTGTNLLRMLLSDECSDLLVLMHALGDKHSPPAPFAHIWSQTRGHPDAAHEFLLRTTTVCPSDTTDPRSPEQRTFIRRWASPVADAYASGRLYAVVSVKAPRAWLTSLWRFEVRMLRRTPTAPTEAIARYNRNYRSWLALEDLGLHVLVVRCEDLVHDSGRTLRRLRTDIGLGRDRRPARLPAHPVRPSPWDHCAPALETVGPPDDGPPAVGRDHVLAMEAALEQVDGGLMRRLGYEAEEL
ncbi:hypothetical protein GCM10023347_40540 [Streptomyces chumphonensis]|uniref:Sulfotransferase n=1 Tax=Streptomyces chumphonensis TaxID=1214925 RepID=A0A927EVB5_9ACTN|nr:hypothetical protein [Streptomyces chumphonensis]MBD3930430.1 hypothetical protein [Streptomyces chumphonensis]